LIFEFELWSDVDPDENCVLDVFRVKAKQDIICELEILPLRMMNDEMMNSLKKEAG
jgi:hypothetical protein